MIEGRSERAGKLILVTLLTTAFILFYGGADLLAELNPRRYSVHFPVELRIPFIPEAAALYLSIQILFLVPLVLWKRTVDLLPLCWTMLFEMVTSSAVFVCAPVRSGFPVRASSENALFRLADALNLENNFFPSLHVAFAFTVAAAASRRSSRTTGVLLFTWASVIALSTLVLHQHHLVDLVGGGVLCALAMRLVYLPLEEDFSRRNHEKANEDSIDVGGSSCSGVGGGRGVGGHAASRG